jgi:hypothetical protein
VVGEGRGPDGLDRTSAAVGGLLLFELVDQIVEVEAATGPGSDNFGGDRDSEMGFDGACSSDQDEVALGFDKSPPTGTTTSSFAVASCSASAQASSTAATPWSAAARGS